jgi:hypothetical protein
MYTYWTTSTFFDRVTFFVRMSDIGRISLFIDLDLVSLYEDVKGVGVVIVSGTFRNTKKGKNKKEKIRKNLEK